MTELKVNKLPKATHEGTLTIGEKDIPCAVLEDGKRILIQSAVFKAFDRPRRSNARLINIPPFLDAQNLQPFIDEEVMEGIKLIDFISKNGKQTAGYSADILPKICKIYLDARAEKVLRSSQLPLARASEKLLLGLANVGIIALVDEATGYQYDREKDELQKILKLWVAPEILDWQKEFKLDFYREIYRLRKWPFTPENINKRPKIIGKYTIQYIYSQLPPGVLDFIKKRTPKSAAGNYLVRLHQSLSPEVGKEHLRNQLISVTTLLSISRSWTEFNNLFLRKYGQTEIDFNTIELPVNKTSRPEKPRIQRAVSFDQSLKGLLAVPPPKEEKE